MAGIENAYCGLAGNELGKGDELDLEEPCKSRV